MTAHPDLYKHYVEGDYNEHLSKVNEIGWGSQPELTAIQNILKINIVIYTVQPKTRELIHTTFVPHPSGQATDTITLLNENQTHYNSLVPK